MYRIYILRPRIPTLTDRQYTLGQRISTFTSLDADLEYNLAWMRRVEMFEGCRVVCWVRLPKDQAKLTLNGFALRGDITLVSEAGRYHNSWDGPGNKRHYAWVQQGGYEADWHRDQRGYQ